MTSIDLEREGESGPQAGQRMGRGHTTGESFQRLGPGLPFSLHLSSREYNVLALPRASGQWSCLAPCTRSGILADLPGPS